MLLTTLVENSTISKNYKNKHGLCIHLKTEKHNILFDLGPDDTFIKNANKLNIDIKAVDIVIISHGHKDHGGGLETFLNYNDKAKIYISRYAFDNYYASLFKFAKVYVGLKKELKFNKRIILTDEFYSIDDELSLVSNITGTVLLPKGNNNLLLKERDNFILDNFKHEQHLIISNSTQNILISGCSHSGILNILKETEERMDLKIDLVIGGLHLFNPINRRIESLNFITELASELSNRNIKFLTCHCTGLKAYGILKSILGTNIQTIKTGQIINL
ncbi:MBL fold metallo-hydrolase [uncultured Clostridium sp.]|uniref:MBL fold metallo-hydrolase n=1 Tax=uncultured Clostridium sp. TaxID=59620 RepID=UPI002583D322|nr:MBL fold metallo-hydrolase [uncultured Clostridium sp.]